MASLNKVVLIPELDRIRTVFGDGPSCLLRRETSVDPQWFISLPNDETFELLVDVKEVVFKFECFGFMFKVINRGHSEEIAEAHAISTIKNIEFLFRAEWRRPALPGEVPGHYMQTIRHLGKLSEIPAEATDVGLSLVGFIWVSEDGDKVRERQALYHDTDETLTVPNFTNDPQKIEDVRSVGTVVGIDGLNDWYAELSAWLEDR